MWPGLIIVTLGWGVLAFGAVYPWASVPLAMACVTLGLAGLVRRLEGATLVGSRRLAVGVCLLALAIGLQILPLPRSVILAISPGSDALLLRRYPEYAALVSAPVDSRGVSHTLSMDPSSTALALGMLLAMGLFLLGSARALTARDVRVLAPGLSALGIVVSLVALIQRTASSPMLYGFWTPSSGAYPEVHAGGPFLNRNHLAGWMLLMLPLALGHFAALVTRTADEAPVGWRDRVLWLSTPAASALVLAGAASLVMAIALVQTLSRSGLAGFLLSTATTGGVVLRSRLPHWRRWLLAAFLLMLVAVALSRTGLATIEARLNESGVSYTDRVAAWQHTLRMFEDVPLVGTGLGTYAEAMVLYQGLDDRVRFAEAHNDYLQLLAEGGLLVTGPVVLLIALFLREVRHRFRDDTHDAVTYWARVGAVTGLVAIAFQETVEFSLQVPGNIALFTVVMAIAAGRLPHRVGFQSDRVARL